MSLCGPSLAPVRRVLIEVANVIVFFLFPLFGYTSDFAWVDVRLKSTNPPPPFLFPPDYVPIRDGGGVTGGLRQINGMLVRTQLSETVLVAYETLGVPADVDDASVVYAVNLAVHDEPERSLAVLNALSIVARLRASRALLQLHQVRKKKGREGVCGRALPCAAFCCLVLRRVVLFCVVLPFVALCCVALCCVVLCYVVSDIGDWNSANCGNGHPPSFSFLVIFTNTRAHTHTHTHKQTPLFDRQ